MPKPPFSRILAVTFPLLAAPGVAWSQQQAPANVIGTDPQRPANVAGTNPPIEAPSLKLGDTGLAVELLQRTLNAQPGATPVDVDGDFGEATRAAVIRFQRSKGLPTTGLADSATRRELGPPPPQGSEPALPAPEVVNAEVLPRKPAEPLDGPPAVLTPYWAIADGKTGELLWGENASKPVEMASTTKMTTALIVARFAQKDPKVLDEVVTFSERADRTIGSTSGLKAGESAPVGELLYGLMLPSGNDAATAFAEHFGPRCAPDAAAPNEVDPISRFVAEMNRVAVELGLAETRYANPHGLPFRDHRSSARDLAKLGSVVLRDPVLAKVVNTRRHGFSPVAADGTKRNVVWNNTNRLLGTEGYDGVKTGTTNGAGNCLVASGHRGDDHLIVVILGAPTTDARYADARNLFRYGWLQKAAAKTQAAR